MTMQSKFKIWSLFLLVILVGGMLCACGSPTPEAPPNSDTPSNPSDSNTSTTPDDEEILPPPIEKIEVVYFYRPQRCTGCIYAEETTLYTLETYFADELASGKITWSTYDVVAEANAAIIEKYEAYTSSLFINTIIDGTDHIQQVMEIWSLLGEDEMFIEVVKNKIEQCLIGEE